MFWQKSCTHCWRANRIIRNWFWLMTQLEWYNACWNLLQLRSNAKFPRYVPRKDSSTFDFGDDENLSNFQNLIPIIVQMSTSKYAHFCVSRMVKYGTPDIKQKIIDAMYGNVVKMINHQHSSAILDNIYISWASSQQKSNLRQEFYGDLYKKVREACLLFIVGTHRISKLFCISVQR